MDGSEGIQLRVWIVTRQEFSKLVCFSNELFTPLHSSRRRFHRRVSACEFNTSRCAKLVAVDAAAQWAFSAS